MQVTKQTTEIAHLQNVLAVLQQDPNRVSDELLRQMLIHPSNAAAGQQIATFFNNPVIPTLTSEPNWFKQAVPMPEPSPILTSFSMAESATTTAPQFVIRPPLVKPLAKPVAKRFVMSESITPVPERTCSSPTSSDGAKRKKITNIDTTSGTHADISELIISSEPTADDDEVASVLLTLQFDSPAAAESGAFVPVAKGSRKRALAEPKASPPSKAVQCPSALRYVPLSGSRYSNYKYSTTVQRINQEVQ